MSSKCVGTCWSTRSSDEVDDDDNECDSDDDDDTIRRCIKLGTNGGGTATRAPNDVQRAAKTTKRSRSTIIIMS